VEKEEDVPEMLRADLSLEQSARPMYQEAIAHCESVQD
jgi:bacterioferritin (cytochrome b1)